MKRNIFKSITTGIIFASMVFAPFAAHAAGSGSFALSPASGTKVKGNNFSVTLYENSSNVSVVTASLTYSADTMQCLGVSGAGAFSGDIGSGCAGGNINISKYITPGAAGLNGSQAVATMSFRALTSAGSGNINLTSGQIASDGVDTWNGAPTAANFSFVAPAPVVIEPAPAPAPAPAPVPVPAKVFTITILVVDSRGNAVQDATVTFAGKTAYSGRNGTIAFGNIKAGTYTVKATKGTVSASTSVTVYERNRTTQQFMVRLPASGRRLNTALVTTGATLAGLLAAASIITMFRNSRRVAKNQAAAAAAKTNKTTKKVVTSNKTAKPLAKKTKTSAKLLNTETA